MAIKLFLLFASIALAGDREVDLKEPDKVRVLQVQREQYRLLSDREKARADFEAAQRKLDEQNSRMAILQGELRLSYGCDACELTEQLKLTRPLPKQVEIVKNK
jgi:hypothetical protein